MTSEQEVKKKIRVSLGYFSDGIITGPGWRYDSSFKHLLTENDYKYMFFYDDEGCTWNPTALQPSGRLIMYQWNHFLRKMKKRYLEKKIKWRKNTLSVINKAFLNEDVNKKITDMC